MRFFICFLASLILISSCNESSKERINNARKFSKKGNYTEAIKLLDQVIADDATNIDALLDRGYCYSQILRTEAAIADYTSVLHIDPRNVLALYNRALNLIKVKRQHSALKDLSEAIMIQGGGIVWTQDKEKNKPNKAYEVSLQELYFQSAILCYEMGIYETAFQDFTYCIDNGYSLEESYYYRGIVYLSYDNLQKGCEDLNLSKSLGNTDADSLIRQYCK